MDGERSSAAPLVVFASRPNSHPFQERHIQCQDPVKIGRSVARAHPAPANAIFDCKVLSRNHALLWFEDTKFYLQDTKSSNGTFVNNQRLSKGSEESDPHEIFSGDIIQFGVDVMENSKRGRSPHRYKKRKPTTRDEECCNAPLVTHGCIMASITLYLPDGTEAKPRFSSGTPTSSHSISAVHSQEMYQLSQYLQEALHREQVLQEKMTHIQTLLHSTNESCESSWRALINEDRLLSKLEVLQNQLSVFSKNQTEGTLQQQIINMEEERLSYETSSKESLRKVLEEKIKAIQELSDVERSLASAEEECKHLKELHQESQRQLSDLTAKHETKVMEHSNLTTQLQEAEQRREHDLLQFDEAREQIEAKLESALAERDSLQAKITHLDSIQQESNSKPEVLHSNGGDDSRVNGDHSEEGDFEQSPESPSSQLLDSLRIQLEESQAKIADYQNKLNDADGVVKEREDEIHRLKEQTDQAQLSIVEYVTKVATLEEKTKAASDSGVVQVEETTDQLKERIKQITVSHEDTVQKLRAELEILRSQASPTGDLDMVDRVKDLQEKLEFSRTDAEELKVQIRTIQEELNHEQKLHSEWREDSVKLRDELDQTRRDMAEQSHATSEFREKAKILEETLHEISEQHKEEVCKGNADKAALSEEVLRSKEQCDALKKECSFLKSRIQAIEDELKRLQQDNSRLGIEVTETKSHNDELANKIDKLQKSYTELQLLKETLELEGSFVKNNLTDVQKEAQLLKDKLEAEKREREELLPKYDQSLEELRLTKEKVEQTQALHSDAQQQLETLKQKLATITEDYTQLADKTKTMPFCSTLPLMMLILAIALALYPLLSRVSSAAAS